MKKNVNKNNNNDIKNKLKKKRKLIPYSNKELIFDVVSLLVIIALGIYFGVRSFYYYGKQNTNYQQAITTLNGIMTNNLTVVSDGDGFHHDTDGYYFKGNVENNYVKFGNRLFRVIRINNDNTVRVVTDDIVSEFMWGEEAEYSKSNLNMWLTKVDGIDQSGIYYDTIPNVSDFLVKTSYTTPTLSNNNVKIGKDKSSDYITTLDIKDYSTANGKNGFLNIKKYSWVIGNDDSGNNLYLDEDGNILTGTTYESYGIRAVMTFKKDLTISGGSGTRVDPYVIDQGDKTNYVDSYVKLGDNIWKVYYDKGGFMKLVCTNFVAEGSGLTYSDESSYFNQYDWGSVARYLNTSLLSVLPYQDKLVDITNYTGEISTDTGLNYTNIYTDSNLTKIGLLNMFDYHNSGFDDYYLLNTTSSVGSNIYVYHNYGLLEEASIEDEKKILPTICLFHDIIDKSAGNGDFTNPYVVG